MTVSDQWRYLEFCILCFYYLAYYLSPCGCSIGRKKKKVNKNGKIARKNAAEKYIGLSVGLFYKFHFFFSPLVNSGFSPDCEHIEIFQRKMSV